MASVLARGKLLVAPNPLAYPAGVAPGFDPTHIALARGVVRFSGVSAAGKSFVNLLKGKGQSSVIGSPVGAVIGALGPSVQFGANDALAFSGQDTSTPAGGNGTIGAIVQFSTLGATFYAVFAANSSSTATGLTLFADSTSKLMLRIGNTNIPSVITLVPNVPYFIAASEDNTIGGNINYVAKRLDTGQVFVDTQPVIGDVIDSDGTYLVGNWGGGTLGTVGFVSAAMYVNNVLSRQQLLQWAKDPWSFWYPNKTTINLTSTAPSGGSFLAAWASNSNRPVIGTGTF